MNNYYVKNIFVVSDDEERSDDRGDEKNCVVANIILRI